MLFMYHLVLLREPLWTPPTDAQALDVGVACRWKQVYMYTRMYMSGFL